MSISLWTTLHLERMGGKMVIVETTRERFGSLERIVLRSRRPFSWWRPRFAAWRRVWEERELERQRPASFALLPDAEVNAPWDFDLVRHREGGK